ncbi:ebp domain-containing protein [Hortaea werneckii]|uniref:EXPERA domain-containing protein n=1 Tax=Hortaea werneckii TaxID=91943 RepID=A0A3M7EX04_HORWE|nr:ebp domain-containing protein [Hortaea werneckii]KAI6860309.1 ebp domain-containing protein [Hortaea werneckii]KAI7196002.1 ebp domain-containing protein [Hortaea werneckii]KAI7346583.1 ebp domain-containing protein [Hortaea werneckii]KAI7571587.1 ebp domain-containing protein [Hortaea werneckii]
MASTIDEPSIVSTTTVLSLLSTVAILATAYFASLSLLPSSSSTKIRVLFVWHAFDALIHFILEGSYLYNCFFSYTTQASGLWQPNEPFVSPYLPPNVYFLGQKERVYGADYGTSPFSALWREYAKADKRWGGSDLTVISLELLTVFIAGPMALWICQCLRKQRTDTWFWMVILATGELYGGFMTFAPEWLSGNPNLDTDNFMYKYVYLFFFNTLWVWIPAWILWEAHWRISANAEFIRKNSALLRQMGVQQQQGSGQTSDGSKSSKKKR